MSKLDLTYKGRRVARVDGVEWLMLGLIAIIIAGISAFIRHCWWTLTLLMSDAPLTAGKAALALLGVFVPPLGALHGVWLWFH